MRLTLVATLFALALGARAAEPPKPGPGKDAADKEALSKQPKAGGDKKDATEPTIVRTLGQVVIAGRPVPYAAETATLVLESDDGKPRASIFHVSYLRTDVEDTGKRPVVFAFNGGPGSSAVWLHLGGLGPKRVDIPQAGTRPPEPPARVQDNPDSILDAADLVFIDPVSTGYSRAAGEAKPQEFHGLRGDIESVGDFIRRWVTEHDRWDSPKFLLGESYGGIRAVGLSSHLQGRYGMSLNGVVLLSTLLDFRTLDQSPGDDLCFAVYLPAFALNALHHGRIEGGRDELAAAAREFAFGRYAAALLQGAALPDDERQAVADRCAELTGLDRQLVLDCNLRVPLERFRVELLREQDRVIGRFDGRVTQSVADRSRTRGGADPSFHFVHGPFATAMLDYLRGDLGWKAEQPYEILTGKVQPWHWDVTNGHVNLSSELLDALNTNPHLRVLVMCGDTDLATPSPGIEYSVRHLALPADQRPAISFEHYAAGHMFYLNPPDRAKMRRDLVGFLGQPR